MRKKKKKAVRPAGHYTSPFEMKVDFELDLHGCTIDEAMAEVEHAFLILKKCSWSTLRVIHGQNHSGSRTIHQELVFNLRNKWHQMVESWHQEPHNLGASIITMIPGFK